MRAIAFSEAQKASCGRRLRGVVWTTGRAETPEILLHRARCRRGRVLLSDKQADMQGDSAFFGKPAAGACQQDLLATTCLPHLGARSYADALKEARAEGPRAHQEQGYVGVRGSFLARSSRACLHGKGRETLDIALGTFLCAEAAALSVAMYRDDPESHMAFLATTTLRRDC